MLAPVEQQMQTKHFVTYVQLDRSTIMNPTITIKFFA